MGRFRGRTDMTVRTPRHMRSVVLALSTLMVLGGVFGGGQMAAQSQTSGTFAPQGHNIRQPVEITSDTLEVDQEKKMAIFAGNVDAIQGELQLRADQLEVYYTTKNGGESPTDSISRMRALGNVFIVSPNETAEGAQADYDVTTRTITLKENVRLTQGTNVLCGDALDLYLDTGRSLLKGGCRNKDGTPQRVQGLFYPSD